MRTLKWVLVLAVPATLVAAQQPEPIAPEGTTIKLILLRQKSVQQELKLTPEVVKTIFEFTSREYDAEQRAEKLSEKEREQKFQELEKANEKFLADTLTAAQRKRLDQITLQVTGLEQLTRPEVIKVLSITEEQQRKFKEMQKEAHKELEEIIGAKEGRNEKLAKLRAEIDKKVLAVLTDKQKEIARELVGEPFKGEIVLEEPKK
jgi:DNA-binding MarR family transcriptional regulator